jgi:hypothetical protein
MPPRPIHRWKTFWLGILVLIFLGWAWQDSRRHETSFSAIREYSWAWLPVGISHADSRLTIRSTHQLGPREAVCTSRGKFHFFRQRTTPTEEPLTLNWKTYPNFISPEANIGLQLIEIPHWFLILLCLISWLAFLTWRWLRMKRQAAGSAELQCSGSGPGQLP